MKVEKALDMEFIEKFSDQMRQIFDTALEEYMSLNTDNALDRFGNFFREKLIKIEDNANRSPR